MHCDLVTPGRGDDFTHLITPAHTYDKNFVHSLPCYERTLDEIERFLTLFPASQNP